MSEIHDIVEVEVTGDYALRLTFDDGAVRDVGLDGQLDGPVFEPLRDPEVFAPSEVVLSRYGGLAAVPENAAGFVELFCERRIPPSDDTRLEVHARGNDVTIVERRPPWRPSSKADRDLRCRLHARLSR